MLYPIAPYATSQTKMFFASPAYKDFTLTSKISATLAEFRIRLAQAARYSMTVKRKSVPPALMAFIFWQATIPV
jgi:hypothetical protein